MYGSEKVNVKSESRIGVHVLFGDDLTCNFIFERYCC